MENENQEVEIVEEGIIEEVVINNVDELYQVCCKNQEEFVKEFKRKRRIQNIITITILVITLLISFMLSGFEFAIAIVIAMVVAYFVFIMIFSNKIKKDLNEKSVVVVAKYFTNLDSLVTKDEAFSEISFNYEEKLPEDAFASLRICKDIIAQGGRDLIQGRFLDYSFIAGDCSVKTSEINQEGVEQHYLVFLGRLFVFEIPVLKEGRAIIYLKGKGANGPTDIEDLEEVKGILSDKFIVYSNTNIDDILLKIKDNLEKFEINDILIDMFISLGEKVGFGLSYSDSALSIPLLDPMKDDDLKQYISDVNLMIDTMKTLVK